MIGVASSSLSPVSCDCSFHTSPNSVQKVCDVGLTFSSIASCYSVSKTRVDVSNPEYVVELRVVPARDSAPDLHNLDVADDETVVTSNTSHQSSLFAQPWQPVYKE